MGQKVNFQYCILKHIYNVRYTTILCNVCKHFVKFKKKGSGRNFITNKKDILFC